MLAGAEPGGADRADRRGDVAHPRRQRRRDAAALQPVQGRRDLQRCSPGSSRGGSTSASAAPPAPTADDVRAAARPSPGVAGRLPAAARRAARLPRRQLPADHPFARLAARCRAARSGPSRGCSAPRRRARSGRPARAALRVRRLHQPATARRSRALYRERFEPTDAARAAALAVAVWAICAETDEEAQRLAVERADDFALLRQGKLIPVPPPEKALRFLDRSRRADAGAAATGAAPSSARRTKVRAGLEEVGARVRRRGGDRRDDHPRPRGSPALLRADRARRSRRHAVHGRSPRFCDKFRKKPPHVPGTSWAAGLIPPDHRCTLA